MRAIPIQASAAIVVAATYFLTMGYAHAAAPLDEVREALGAMHTWADASPYGQAWRDYLRSDRLGTELAKDAAADPAVVAEILARYSGDAEELALPRFAAVRGALAEWLAELSGPSMGGLPAHVRAAKSGYVPLSKAALAESRSRLAEALRALDARLAVDGPNGQAWRDYLSWQVLQAELAKGDQADLAGLDDVFYKFDAGHDGLGLYWFRDVRQALRDYLTAARALDQADLKDNYGALLDALADHLQKIDPVPTAQQTAGISNALGWLRDARQAPWLVAGIRRRFARPNLVAQVSADMVRAGVGRPVDDVAPVTDYILGTDIRGTGHTVGQITARLVRNSAKAEVEIHFSGTTRSDTIGYHGPAQAYNTGTTTLAARKTLWIDAEGIVASPSVAQADTDTTIDAIALRRGGQIAERIAWKKACRQKPQAEQIAARHAEDRLNRRIDEQIGQEVAKSNERLTAQFRRPLLERRLFPSRLEISSTEDALHVVALEAGEVQLASPVDPPPLEGKPDIALRLHESLVNNAAALGLSGMILTEERFNQMGDEQIRKMLKATRPEEEGEPWTIHFAQQQPVFVAFAGGKFTVTIRGTAFARGENLYPGMDVTAEYEIAKTDGGFKAVRQGDLRIFPPGFVPGAGEQLSAREQVLRDLLRRRFAKVFPAEIVPEPGPLPGEWKAAGKMALCQWEARDGWLVMAWKRVGPADDEGGREGSAHQGSAQE